MENIIQSKSCLSCPFERQSDYQARNLDSSHSLKRYLPSLNAGHLDNEISKSGSFLSVGPCFVDKAWQYLNGRTDEWQNSSLKNSTNAKLRLQHSTD